jgi:serine/threonine-protein kinase
VSLADRLAQQFGEGVDPSVTLERRETPTADTAVSKLVGELSARSPKQSRYQIAGEIARGGMGVVLKVWDADLRRALAMKVVRDKSGDPNQGSIPAVDSKALGRFLEEAQVTGQLDHPGVVPVHELGVDAAGRVYFTMKLVKGKTLQEVFDEVTNGKGGWTQARVLGVILRVCEAMSYAHAKGVIHRDIKPSNIMVGRYGEVYVMDWGLAKILNRQEKRDIRIQDRPTQAISEVRSYRSRPTAESTDSPLYTMDGDVVGTPAYMPPEQAKGDLAEMGPHSDVYAVGAMLYHLLTGHVPYVGAGVRANNYAVWRWVTEGPPTPLVKGRHPSRS